MGIMACSAKYASCFYGPFRDALDSARIKIGLSADEILGRPAFAYATMKLEVELAIV